MLKKVAILVALLAAGGLAFLVVSLLNQPSGGPSIHAISNLTTCEVDLGADKCPANPTLVPGRPRVIFDQHEGADRNLDRCMLRAKEYFAACRGKFGVTARFYRGRQLVRSVTEK